jgi:pimeloyl-ACP methyl ester carboxylesterase
MSRWGPLALATALQRMPVIKIANRQLEYEWHGPSPNRSGAAPTLVFLHEGLGCVAMWRDFPARVAEQTGCGTLVYSRAGYGKSDPIELPRPVTFMHEEALAILPQLLDAFSIRAAILVGHSDGASISIIHAGGTGDPRVRGLILEAPHVFVEEIGLESIRAIAEQYQTQSAGRMPAHRPQDAGAPMAPMGASVLRQRLARHHGQNVDATFWGWNDVWLNPEFESWSIEEYLPKISVPVLLIQGEDDQYGTREQIRRIEAGCNGAVRTVLLSKCGHSPHLDQPERTVEAMKEFVGEVFGVR